MTQNSDAKDYAQSSVLASGKWVKVSVDETGIHFLSAKQLQSMGFSNPKDVKIFGYGGKRLPDLLTPKTYIDDLPQVPVHRIDEGMFFYAVGPESLSSDIKGNIHYQSNPFTDFGYYFLTEASHVSDKDIPSTGYPESVGFPATTFTQVLQHEVDLYSPGSTGHYLVGEDLKFTPSRTFGFNLTDKADGDIAIGASVMSNLVSGATWTLRAADDIEKITALPASSAQSYYHGDESTAWITLSDYEKDDVTVKISIGGGSGNIRNAFVDWVAINYQREIKIPKQGSPSIVFNTYAESITIGNVTGSTIVWDITDPLDVKGLNISEPDEFGNSYFTVPLRGERYYVAFNTMPNVNFPTPAFIENVSNQDLHSIRDVDMVIFSTVQSFKAAETLGRYRREVDGLEVAVVNQQNVFNEFSSGSPDVNAFRKFLKMLSDRSSTSDAHAPRYALLMGRSVFDNRRHTKAAASLPYETMPVWQTDEGLNDNYTYPTDDLLGFLDDYSGRDFSADTLNVAVGRLPVTSETGAMLMVKKIIDYETSSPYGQWQSRAVFIADDDDQGIHMSQTEDMIEAMRDADGSLPLLPEKIYLDAYDYLNGTAVAARKEFYKILDEGALWVSFIGHANSTSLSAEGILNYSDVGSIYLNKLPFIYAGTCDFMRWDDIDISGAEMLAATQGGGVIGAISATRPVFINKNGLLSRKIGEFMASRGQDGKHLTVGEIFAKAKNALGRDDNKLRFALLGDPAMHLKLPHYSMEIDTVGSEAFSPSTSDVVFKGMQDVTLVGRIVDPLNRKTLTQFNGIVNSVLYDAMEGVVTKGHGSEGVRYAFDRHGTRLFAGADSVVNGHFTVNIAMPSEVADNFREATLVLCASDLKNDASASLVEQRLYVFGTEENATADTIAPVIEEMYLNHPSFVNGSIVNASPLLSAVISDNHAINMSLAGIGHWMTLSLDNGAVTYSDVSDYYTPQNIGRGVINYPLNGLDNGAHTLTLRVWDASGNSASRTIEFFVDSYAPIKVYDIYADYNPASSTASFYLVHDRPEADLKVEFMIYDLLGRQVWTHTSTGKANRYETFPITWNLSDQGGHRVERGIYLYRAIVSETGQSVLNSTGVPTPTRKLAVTSR